MRKVTKKDINKENMVVLYYCQCQQILRMFADDYKVGYNTGINGWNYDLYNINGISIIHGYNPPYEKNNNQDLKRALVKLNNKVAKLSMMEVYKSYQHLKKEFLEIFE